jgi:leader peptidase (prepilin peptidase) / N-methyltransferase
MIFFLVIFAVLLGGALGSFVGVVASRGLRDSLGGRSHCDSCARILQWYELVPLLSYLALRGRCRTCGTRVGAGVYAWEVGGALIALAVALSIAAAVGVPAP